MSYEPRLPRSFAEAITFPAWRQAIDREYYALVDRHTWRYVYRTGDMHPVPFTWVFKLKQLDAQGLELLHKGRCCICGDRRQPYIDFDPHNTYAPVASHKAIRLLLAFAADNRLIFEGADVGNASLYRHINVPIIMQQPTNSTGRKAYPGMVCLLLKSSYGLKHAGEIWGLFYALRYYLGLESLKRR